VRGEKGTEGEEEGELKGLALPSLSPVTPVRIKAA
jgi:hypothetical protein